MVEIPLQGGSVNAHQRFDAQLGDNLVSFRLNYVQTGQWVVDISTSDVEIINGVMLEPNCNVLAHYDLGIGRLIFIGKNTTLDNLGIENKLLWTQDGESQ